MPHPSDDPLLNDPAALRERERAIGDISRRHLGVDTLTRRLSDRLDFHDLAVWSIEAALAAAYEAGRLSRGM